MTKGMAAMLVKTTKECNYNSIVIVHQYGGCDVTCKPSIQSTIIMITILLSTSINNNNNNNNNNNKHNNIIIIITTIK